MPDDWKDTYKAESSKEDIIYKSFKYITDVFEFTPIDQSPYRAEVQKAWLAVRRPMAKQLIRHSYVQLALQYWRPEENSVYPTMNDIHMLNNVHGLEYLVWALEQHRSRSESPQPHPGPSSQAGRNITTGDPSSFDSPKSGMFSMDI
ncbi:hypothetical protein JR316_0006635 [Psilocybe cubensis]|uniref:Uncharacterized protein n=2 Tax=Psilocybe cubensis TaxID=181762 RepID=A0ACB8GWM5_PSICU|nr:hypothetical protein JR316_0006635 [Psilocybe cubensis]KAH9480038.1 hypothetical protein JR316_0006635 [Psilocybe cubensis]